MAVQFTPGSYKIVNAKNGNINIPPILPTIIPVFAASEGAVWQIKSSPAENFGFKVHHLVHILKDGQPANLEGKGLLPGDKGTLAIHIGAQPNVWCLHRVFGDLYLIYFSRKGTEHHGKSHWQLLSSEPGTNVIVSADHHHPINKVLDDHILAGFGASLEDLSGKLEELHHHHPECFWLLKRIA